MTPRRRPSILTLESPLILRLCLPVLRIQRIRSTRTLMEHLNCFGQPERVGPINQTSFLSVACSSSYLHSIGTFLPMKDYTIYDTGFTAYGDAVRSATLNKVFKTFETPPEKGLEGLHVDKYWMCWIRAMVECQPHLRPSAKQLLMHHICALSGSGVWKRVLFREVNDIKISLACHGINLVMTDEVLHRAWKTLKRPRISWLLCQVFHARN